MKDLQRRVAAVGKALRDSRDNPADLDLARFCEIKANELVDWARKNPPCINLEMALTYCGRAYERFEEAKRRNK